MIDFLVRTSVARWAYAVAQETPVDPVKGAIAKRMIESISPATPTQDSALVHVVFLVRVILNLPSGDDPTAEAVDQAVELIMNVCGRLGAFGG